MPWAARVPAARERHAVQAPVLRWDVHFAAVPVLTRIHGVRAVGLDWH